MKQVYVHYDIETVETLSDRYPKPLWLVADIEVEERVSLRQHNITRYHVTATSVDELDQKVKEAIA